MKLPKHAEIWLPGYVASRFRHLLHKQRPKHLWVTITDHFEPYWHNTDDALALQRVLQWRKRWPEIAKRHVDSVGRHPQYTFFYPEEEYRPALLDPLAEIKDLGLGDVEVHLHHDNDTESAFLDKVSAYKQTLHQNHGLLRKHNGEIVFGFIHGNWCLDNSHPEGRFCGLNNEITLLKQLGCYADFTMPCGPYHMQARLLNEIYWAVDDPAAPKSYDRGTSITLSPPPSNALMMITGPFGLHCSFGAKPKLDIGQLPHHPVPMDRRIRCWLAVAPRIADHLFLKLFTHGTQEVNSTTLFNTALQNLFSALSVATKALSLNLRYATASEMYSAARSAANTNTPDIRAAT